MDEVLTRLSFHPGHPILILFGMAAALAYVCAGAVIFKIGVRWARFVWAVGLVFLVLEVIVTVHVQRQLEWNPVVEPRELVGAWGGNGLVLELRPDGTFAAGDQQGTWHIAGAGLVLSPEPKGFRGPRFSRFGTRLWLAPVTGDPDEWAGELGLRRLPPSEGNGPH